MRRLAWTDLVRRRPGLITLEAFARGQRLKGIEADGFEAIEAALRLTIGPDSVYSRFSVVGSVHAFEVAREHLREVWDRSHPQTV